ncbi:phosphonate C-P lyase system protein PhnH [Pseudonocardia sp. DLS-67]
MTSALLPVLDADTAQRAFRVVLDALAHPGVPADLPVTEAPAALLPVLALADLDTPTCVLGDTVDDAGDGAWAVALGTATSAPVAALGSARLVAALRPLATGELGAIRAGSAGAPEEAALVTLAVPALDGGPALTLSGPGVPGTRTVTPRGLPADLVATRAATVFPAGPDLLFVTPDGAVLGIPRSTRIEES